VGNEAPSASLVGRETELATLYAFVDAGTPPARTLVVAGGPGFGKTSLWEAGVEWARRQNMAVLTARPTEPETQLSFAALSDLLEPVDGDVLGVLPDPQRRALEVALLRSEPSDRPPEARAIAAGVLGALRELSSRAPLVVAIDDTQWLDAASAGALRFAHRRFENEAIAFLLTERTDTGAVPFGAERAERVDIGGLSMGAARLLLAERLDFQPPRALVRRIVDATGGNPLFTLELARALRDTDGVPRPDQPFEFPNELAVLLRERLSKLSERARTAALGAALASDPSPALVEALLGADAAAALNELVGAGVVEVNGHRLRFTHPLLASAVSNAALPQQRYAIQRELARLVDDPVASAKHLAHAGVEPDGEIAVVLEDAAMLARARGDWDTAADLYERSRDLTPASDGENRQRRWIAAAEYHAHSGDRARARVLVEELLQEELPRVQRAHTLRLLAGVSAEDENFAGAIAIYEQALAFVDDPLLEATIEGELAYVASSSWDLGAAAHALHALEIAEACGDETLISRSLAACAMVDFMFGRGVDWAKVERALSLEDHNAVMPLQVRPSTVAGLLHVYSGNHVEGRDRLTAAWSRASDQGDEGDLPFVLIWLSWLETRAGNLGAAASLAEQAETLAGLTGSESMRAFAIAQHAYVYAHIGDETAARDEAARATAVAESVGFFLPHLWVSATLALLELSVANPGAAWNACEPLIAPIEAFGIGEPVLPFFLPEAIEALITLGQLDRAEQLNTAFEHAGHQLDRPWARAIGARGRALLRAAQGDVEGSASALEDALDEHERLDMPFQRARTLLVKGLVERRMKQRANARTSLTTALETFEQVGARLWADRARDELARVSGRRRRSPDGLTPTEQRVVELAIAGRSNKEIAEELFVSLHTVETHLTHVYSKLGVRSRSQLPRDLSPLN
jgi:DNA-binding CsgD family transcriptional regulator